jgi:hypothetical protein
MLPSQRPSSVGNHEQSHAGRFSMVTGNGTGSAAFRHGARGKNLFLCKDADLYATFLRFRRRSTKPRDISPIVAGLGVGYCLKVKRTGSSSLRSLRVRLRLTLRNTRSMHWPDSHSGWYRNRGQVSMIPPNPPSRPVFALKDPNTSFSWHDITLQ